VNNSLKILQYRNGAPAKAKKILCRQPSLSDESREEGVSTPQNHLDRHRRKHKSGHRRPNRRSRENAEEQHDNAERTLTQGGQEPPKAEVIRWRFPKEVR
jgi:hypothetical protein